MVSSQSTTDLDAQITKLEEKLNQLLDKVQQAQTNSDSSIQTSSSPKPTAQTQKYTSSQTQQTPINRKSRQEILAEYEKDYLARLQENERAQEEIRRVAAELESQKKPKKENSTRGSLPKGF